jgi:large repetitive protein
MRKLRLMFTALLLFTIAFAFNTQALENEFESSIGTVNNYETVDINGLKYEYLDVTKENGYPAKIFHASFDPKNSGYEMVVADSYKVNGWGNATTMDVATRYEQLTGRKVYAAVNGDFFFTDHSDRSYIKPLGPYVRDGIVYKFGTTNAFAFNSNGEYTTSKFTETASNWTYKVVFTNGDVKKEIYVDKINQAPLAGELAIFVGEGKTFTMNTANTGKYLAKVGNYGYYRPLDATAYRLTKGSKTTNQAVTVNSGYIGFEINNNPELLNWFYDNYSICNTQVEVVKMAAGEFAKFPNVIGGQRILVNNGVATKYPNPSDHESTAHPRTTIGVTTDGRFFVTALDGRNAQWSQGFPSELQALVAEDFGAQFALELDGGGSTTFILRVDDKLTVMNKPSDGGLRADANHVLIVEKEPSLKTSASSLTTNTSVVPCYAEDKALPVNPVEVLEEANGTPIAIISLMAVVSLAGVILLIKRK